MKLIFVLLFTSLLPLSEFGVDEPADWVAKQITVDSFADLSVESAGNVVVLYSPKNTLQINGEASCIDGFDAEVKDQTLYLSRKEGFDTCNTEIVIGAPKITDINLKNGGIINLSSVRADSMFAHIEGGGIISLDAGQFLYGKVKNGGVINYKGNPEVHSDIVNTGEVIKN